MTRWERLLLLLDITDSEFELEHASKFDLSPEEWLRSRIKIVFEIGDKDKILADFQRGEPCCSKTSA